MNQLKVLNTLIKAGKPCPKLFNNLLLNADENATKIIRKSMTFLGINAVKLQDLNCSISLSKSEPIIWDRFRQIYDLNQIPDEKTMCALMDYYVEDLEMVKKIHNQMAVGIGKNLKSLLDGNTDDESVDTNDFIRIQHTELSKKSMLNAFVAARDLKGAYDLLGEIPKDPESLMSFQSFKMKDSPRYIEEVMYLFKRAQINRTIDKYQALEPKIQYYFVKQDFVELANVIRKYLEGNVNRVNSLKMQPIILNYYLKHHKFQEAFELFMDFNPTVQIESIPYLMATLTKLDATSRLSEAEIFEMVQFVWNVYIFLLKSGNPFKSYHKLTRTLQHTLRYFLKNGNEEYPDKVLYHALNNSVRIDIHLLTEYGKFKLEKNGNIWTHLLIPTLAYPHLYTKYDPFAELENSQTLENSGLLPEDLYQDEDALFEFPYFIEPEIEANLIEVLLLLFGISVQVDYTQCQTKISTKIAFKSFYRAIKCKANREVFRLLARLSALKGYSDLLPEFMKQLKIARK
jgi:hypothetical protein